MNRNARTVFLVEDSAALCERIRALLGEAEGVRVVGQASGASDAIEAVRNLGPDVVVLDLSLAEGNGFDVLHELRHSGDSARVIVLTNHSSVPYRRRALAAGADCFLDKSAEFDRLVEAILQSDDPTTASNQH